MAKRGRPPHPDILTPREWEVLALLREELSNEQIAERLGVSVRTARYHVSEILSKLGVGSRKEAAAWLASGGERRPWWTTAVAPVAFLWRRTAASVPAGLSTAATALSAGLLLALVAVLGLIGFFLLRGDDEAPRVAAVLPTPTTGVQATATVAAEAGTEISDFWAFPEGTVWVLMDRGLFRTDDAGATWTEVTPPELRGLPYASRPGVFFLNASRGWLATFPVTPGPAPATVFRTRDGGQTWKSHVVELDAGGGRPFGGSGYLFFLDDSTGWMMSKLGTNTASSRGVLHRTDDGGDTWRQVSIPLGEPVHFTSPTDGWTAGGVPTDQLYVTHDGGVTWEQPEEIPYRSGGRPWDTKVAVPHFFDDRNGVLPVQDDSDAAAGGGQNLYFYTTHDGGSSWAAAGPPVHLPIGGGERFLGEARGLELVDPRNWLLDADQLYVTHDGGGTWSVVDGHENALNIQDINFATPEEGWAYWRKDTCVAKGVGCATESRLLKTLDGGQTWEEVPLP